MSAKAPPTRVREGSAVGMLGDVTKWPLLRPFIGQERTVKSAAAEASLPLRKMFHFVSRAEAAGLIRVTRLEPRRGRVIKHYRAVAQRFFVALDDLPGCDLVEHIEELEQATRPHIRRAIAGQIQLRLDNDSNPARWGRMYGLDESGEFRQLGFVPEDGETRQQAFWHPPELPPLLLGRGKLRMSRQAAELFRDQFMALLERYQGSGDGEEYWFEINFARAPR